MHVSYLIVAILLLFFSKIINKLIINNQSNNSEYSNRREKSTKIVISKPFIDNRGIGNCISGFIMSVIISKYSKRCIIGINTKYN